MTKLATICYLDNGKEFLLLLRNKKPNDVHEGKYIGVGGKLEAAETPEECAVREIFEETGLTATKMEMKGIITFPEFTPGHDWYTYVFRVTEFSRERSIQSHYQTCRGASHKPAFYILRGDFHIIKGQC